MKIINYSKPNMSNLRGKSGRKVFNEIKNAKRTPIERYKRIARKYNDKLIEESR